MTERPTRTAIAIQLVALAAVLGVAIYRAPDADWNLTLLGILLVLGVASDLLRVEVRAYRIFVSSSFLTIVLATVFLGETPAAMIGVRHDRGGLGSAERYPTTLLINLVTYAWFPLLSGIAFDAVSNGSGSARPTPLLPARLRPLRARPGDRLHPDRRLLSYVEGTRFPTKVRRALVPLLPVRARLRAARGRGRLPLRPVRLRRDGPVRGRHHRLPVPDRRPARLPAASATSSSCAPSSSPASRSRCWRAAAHPRPARPDDRAPQRRGRPLLAGDRGRAPGSPRRSRSSSTPPACCTTSASSCFPTAS